MTEHTDEHDRRIVVGIDGSPGSRAALRWAMTQARLTATSIEAVSAWQESSIVTDTYGWMIPPNEGVSIPAITAKALDGTVAEVTLHEDGDAVEIRTRVAQGHPAQVLLEAAAEAQLLVVGSRGLGTFSGILLGSVSQHCVQHAPCPVVVVPE